MSKMTRVQGERSGATDEARWKRSNGKACPCPELVYFFRGDVKVKHEDTAGDRRALLDQVDMRALVLLRA